MPDGDDYKPMRRFTDLFPEISGNAVNGLGERDERLASPFFWHPPETQTHGALQREVISYHRKSAAMREEFSPTPPGGRGPEPVERAAEKIEKSTDEWTADVRQFALANEGDVVGIAEMKPAYIYEGYDIPHRWIILIGVAMDYDIMSSVPPSFESPAAGAEVGRQYNRAARACRKLANHILSQGHEATAWPGPYASALNMIPAAIAAGLGELGKHGSMINRQFGSNFRLSAVTTDLPLLADEPDEFGADDFCTNCQICTRACPPDAIFEDKQWVRGVKKWYVDFDKCIPYFGERLACGICIVRCPWSRPGTAPRLAEKLTKRRESRARR